ncbi:hypothetical protein LguiA_023291 [Lonicera macranthoides]
MADFAPPTFSLGLDFDLDSEPQTTTLREEDPSPKSSPQSSTFPTLPTIQDFVDDDFESRSMALDPEASEQPRTLKRLRRGSTNEPPSVAQKLEESVDLWGNVDDDIEEFSSQEDAHRANEPLPMQSHSVCSISKFPLRGHGVVTTQLARKKKPDSNAPSSSNLETTSSKLTFPKLTVSPLRRFQLIDSDSDDPSISEGTNRAANKAGSSLKGTEFNPQQNVSSTEQWKTKASVSKSQTEDLWSDFSLKNFHIPTPAFDEFCEEHSKSVQNKNDGHNNTKGCYQSSNISKIYEQQINLGDPLPPAHCYFFHDDPRIQELVRSRLPNFFPLSTVNNGGYKGPSASVIDYMGQFSKGEGSKRASRKSNYETSTSRSRRSSKKSNAEVLSQGSRSWVNPRCSAGIPKDAGQRRVHAVGQSAGHWYTGPNGKRVYLTKDGQELTGQIAYRRYKKESGGGFKRSKKKATGKKK